MWIVAAILIAAIVLFITEWLRVDVVALAVLVALMLSGVLTTNEALAGFSNSVVLTIAALFIVGGGVMQTGLADQIGRRILDVAGRSEQRLIVVLMLAVALLSGFLSNTGTVAVLLPAVVLLARRAQISPSRLLIPLAYGSLFGGAVTLIGTPPNIIVSDLLREQGQTAFGFFSFAPLGLALLAAGMFFMLTIGRRLLPARSDGRAQTPPLEEHRRVLDEYRLEDDLCRLRVRRDSPLVGKTVAESNLRRAFDVTVLKIMRPAQPRPALSLMGARPGANAAAAEPVSDAHSVPVVVEPSTVIAVDDVLIVRGDDRDVQQAAVAWNLGIQPANPKDQKALLGREVGVAEVLLPARSAVIGQTLTQSRFGDLYHLSVLGIHRPGVGFIEKESDLPLRFGDVLIVQGAWEQIAALKQKMRDFIVLGQPEAMVGAPNANKAGVALAVLIGMVILMAGGWLPLATIAMAASLVMVLSGCLTMDEAYRAIDWKSLVLIAGMLPMSTALEKVGLVATVADGFVAGLGPLGPSAVMAGLFLLTALFTQLLSNTATTVIVGPIALAAALQLGVQPQAFLMAVAVAASMAFASPVGSPVNTLVMGPGNYRFGDFAKIGIPLLVLSLFVTLFVLPLLFPY